MAGTHYKVTVRDRQVTAALERLAAADRNLIPPFLKNAGELLIKSTRQRFDREVDPSGARWTALNPEYAAGKRSRKILQESGMQGGLLGSIVYRVSGGTLAWGTNKIYGALMHFGGTVVPRTADALIFRLGGKLVFAKKVTIPGRPYLGVSAEDRAGLVQLAADVVATDWGSGA